MMNVGQMIELLRSAAENLRYSAGRIRELEKQASTQADLLRKNTLADTLRATGMAQSPEEARELIRKMAGMTPAEAVASVIASPMAMFVPSDDGHPGTSASGSTRLLTNEQFLAELTSGGSGAQE